MLINPAERWSFMRNVGFYRQSLFILTSTVPTLHIMSRQIVLDLSVDLGVIKASLSAWKQWRDTVQVAAADMLLSNINTQIYQSTWCRMWTFRPQIVLNLMKNSCILSSFDISVPTVLSVGEKKIVISSYSTVSTRHSGSKSTVGCIKSCESCCVPRTSLPHGGVCFWIAIL